MVDYPDGFCLPRGYVIYAHNNPSIDYGSMALCNALLIKKHLKENAVALIADSGTIGHLEKTYDDSLLQRAFDRMIIDEPDETLLSTRRFFDTRYSHFTDRYRNLNRPNIYDLTPFDETILIDADYLQLDSSLDNAWGSVEDFMCNSKTRDLDHKINNFGFDNRFNEMSIPLYWATAVYFAKTEKSQLIFQLMNYVKENYAYYQYLYRFHHSGYFRNDYALSIAIHLANNLMEWNSIANLPTDYILFSLEDDEMHRFEDGQCIITSEPNGGEFHMHRVISNVHVMNKRALLRHKEEIIRYAVS